MDGTPELNIVFYEPGSNSESTGRALARRARWEGIVDHIMRGLSSDRRGLTVAFLRALPIFIEEEPIQTAKRLGYDILLDGNRETRAFKEVLLATFCVVLHRQGLNSPEETDQILKIISANSRSKYLNVLMRGARVANEIVVEWATQQGDGQDALHQLGRATAALYTGCLSIYQWGVIADYKREAKQRVLSYPLPAAAAPSDTSAALLIPCLIESVTGGRLTSANVCRCLGYDVDLFAASATVVLAYRGLLRVSSDLQPTEETCSGKIALVSPSNQGHNT
ncbi:hypothetical protein QBC46DRAFT_381743 [Diplogelasinospora grovesii]|uniref:Uncharacterized protein n=1 Tax=Diplogelasinospora grovesii TaxID=303347 RepID=A0AAN6NAY3_9PEZI|nr:hypothetical protein QBC46DRAFT_381743 [Diplogelasinospora grovesii]